MLQRKTPTKHEGSNPSCSLHIIQATVKKLNLNNCKCHHEECLAKPKQNPLRVYIDPLEDLEAFSNESVIWIIYKQCITR